MGKLLTGRYGEEPSAESKIVSLIECNQKLGMKPSDFISQTAPDFFTKARGAKGRYLVFRSDDKEVAGNPIWRAGYYLLPVDAADILEAFARRRPGGDAGAPRSSGLPLEIDLSASPPEPILANAKRWATDSQPLFFQCKCDHLELTIDAPWGLRRRWKAQLKCPDRCQPQIKTLL